MKHLTITILIAFSTRGGRRKRNLQYAKPVSELVAANGAVS